MFLSKMGKLAFSSAAVLWFCLCVRCSATDSNLPRLNFTENVLDRIPVHIEAQELQQRVYPFSALRSNDGIVEVYFEAEDYLARLLQCRFSREQPENNSGIFPGKVDKIGHSTRHFTGYVLRCADPGPHFDTLDLCYTRHVIKSVKIEVIPEEPLGVGVCVGPVYSKRPSFLPWAQSTLDAGFSAIHLYYTAVKDPVALNPHYARWVYGPHAGDPSSLEPFVPVDLPGVQYIYFEAPAQTWTFAESTLYTECIRRFRRQHSFIAVADTDEFFARPPKAKEAYPDLSTFFGKLMPNNTASLILNALMYPVACHPKPHTWEDNHFFSRTLNNTQPKSVVVPDRVKLYRVHTIAAAMEGYKFGIHLSSSTAYWKHVRLGNKCPPNVGDDRIDDLPQCSVWDTCSAPLS